MARINKIVRARINRKEYMRISGTIEEVRFDGKTYTFVVGVNEEIVYADKDQFSFFNRVPKYGEFIIFHIDSNTHYMHSFSR
jgi:hypothetical protein